MRGRNVGLGIAKISDGDTTVYVRDASGNVMGVYKNDTLIEQSIYGSSRLGLMTASSKTGYRTLGGKKYELSNHLGNVLAVVTDNINLDQDTTWANVINTTDYYPFGLAMDGRTEQDSSYRYGFNGKEHDQNGEWGSKSHYDYGFRIYNPSIAKFLSVDPLAISFPWNSPYAFAENDVIRSIDLEGLEKLIMTKVNSETRTAQITIKKDIQIANTPNLPASYASIDNGRVNKLFSKGNTTLYTSELPINGQPVNFTKKRDWLKKGGYKIDVVYDVNVEVIEPSSLDPSFGGDGGRVSKVYTSNSPFKDVEGNVKPGAGARAGTTEGTDLQVTLNPGFSGGLSPEEVITHEVGIHNMAGKLHSQTKSGQAIYPSSPTLESNVPGRIYPVQEDTKAIINKNLKMERLEHDKN